MLESDHVLHSWVNAKPGKRSTPAKNEGKRAWVLANPFYIHLSQATTESFLRKSGDLLEKMWTLSTDMVHNILGLCPPTSYSLTGSEPFKLMHAFSTGHAYNITATLDLEQCPRYLISYYGNEAFCTTAIEMIKLYFPCLPYVSKLHHHVMLTSLLSIPGAMVAAATCRFYSSIDETVKMSAFKQQELSELERACLCELKELQQALVTVSPGITTDHEKDRLIHYKDVSAIAHEVLQGIHPLFQDSGSYVDSDESPLKPLLELLAAIIDNV